MEGPVYSSALGPPHYNVDRRALQYMPPYGAYGQWGGFAKDKRFMVSRKRDVSVVYIYLSQTPRASSASPEAASSLFTFI